MLRLESTPAAVVLAAATCSLAAGGYAMASEDAGPPVPEPPASESAWLANATGVSGPFRIWGYSCNDNTRADHVVLQHDSGSNPGGPPPRGLCSAPTGRPGAERAITGRVTGSNGWGLAYIGVTRADVDAVDVVTPTGSVRTRTLKPDASAASAGLPGDFRLYYVTAPWDNPGPDGPWHFRGAVALRDGRVVGCTSEIRCARGARPKRSGRYRTEPARSR